jgi:hypothetical protein
MLVMTTPPDSTNTPMRWYVRSAGHRDAHHGALAMNGTVLARCGLTFTPQPDLFEPGPLWPRAPANPAPCRPTCLATSPREPTEAVDGASVARLIETL